MHNIDFKKNVPIYGKYDLVVCGGGLSGVAAAICASRHGAKTLLIENTGKVGGVSVSGLLGAVSGQIMKDEEVVSGFLRELIDRCREMNVVNDMEWCAVFNPELLNHVLLEMLVEAGVELLLYTRVADARREGERIIDVIICTGSGMRAVVAPVFIDATGDGYLAYVSGCEYDMGRDSDGLTQSATLVFKIGGVKLDKVPPVTEITELWRKHGPNSVPTDHAAVKFIHHDNTDGEAVINMTHILRFNGVDNRELSRSRLEGSRQSIQILKFFRKHIEGFSGAYINASAESIGVRETRRIKGDYQLCAADVISGTDFPDQIARCLWSVDIHNPDGVHFGMSKHLSKSYGIPYRCITPVGISNLYMAGRPISSDHVAYSSCRIASTGVALGEAAGVAAIMAAASGDTRKVDVKELQRKLRFQGAVIERKHLQKQENCNEKIKEQM
jgi:hypothetical protein